jgi:hypothetical protein
LYRALHVTDAGEPVRRGRHCERRRLIEAKRAKTKLAAAKHLRQVEMYAVDEAVEWAVPASTSRNN